MLLYWLRFLHQSDRIKLLRSFICGQRFILSCTLFHIAAFLLIIVIGSFLLVALGLAFGGRVSADCNGSIHMLKGAAVCTLLFVLTISEDWK